MRIILQPYQTISEASELTGLPEHELRQGCKDGTVPHIRSNGRFYVDLPALWDRLDAAQRDNVKE